MQVLKKKKFQNKNIDNKAKGFLKFCFNILDSTSRILNICPVLNSASSKTLRYKFLLKFEYVIESSSAILMPLFRISNI